MRQGHNPGGDDDEPNEVSISGQEFSFTFDGELVAGTNAITLRNDGQQEHHLQLLTVPEGTTVEDLLAGLAAIDEGGPPPAGVTFAGGVGLLAPGRSATMVGSFTAGTYALVCFIPDEADGVPHAVKGMAAFVTVSGDENEAEIPEADFAVSGVDDGAGTSYSFNAPATVDAGEVVMRFTNAGSELHEAILARLEGITLDQFVEAVLSEESGGPPEGAPEGPPPFSAVGGVQVLVPGAGQTVTMNLEAGTYVLICFIPNPEGVPHIALGMAREFTVE